MNSDNARGVLLGLACGDALGRPVEFASDAQIAAEYGRLTDMVGNGTWNQPAGTITDDTEQALCIARSLVERRTFDPADVADRFVAWYESGPFDVGNMTARSLREIQRGSTWNEAGRTVWENSPEGQNAGNGSVMRCPPLSVAYAADPDSLVDVSRRSSQITHFDPRCTDGCAILNLTLAGLLEGADASLRDALDRVSDAPDELTAALEPLAADGSVAADSDTADDSLTLRTTGYVVHSLQTALHDGLTADSAEEAITTAVNCGGDTDTIGAITGAVAGARFGASGLPDRWLSHVDEADELETLADRLAEVA